MKDDSFESVWDAIEDTREAAQNMKLRSTLMMAIEDHIRANGGSRSEAARRLHVTAPRISDLMRAKLDRFGLDRPVNRATFVGLRLELRVASAA